MKIFFDTMIFLHYRNLEEIDFNQIFGPPPHTVLIPRITLRELDKHKNTHSSSRIRERARKMLKKIEQWSGGVEILPGVSVEFLKGVPQVHYPELGLNSEWNDDVLIASVIQCMKDRPENSSVILVTQDSGPRITASQLGIKSLELPEEYKLPVEPDLLEIENRELKRKLSILHNALPELGIDIIGQNDKGKFSSFIISQHPELTDNEITTKIQELIEKFPKQHRKMSSISSIQAHMDFIPITEYERYNKEIDEYIKSYERYMRNKWKIQAANKRSIQFGIEIRNMGRSPAEDVDVLLHFSDGFHLLSADKMPSLPKMPLPPTKPRTTIEISINDALYSIRPFVPEWNVPAEMQIPFSITRMETGGYEVRDHFERIKHGASAALPEMFLTFDSYESARSFSCHYIIRPANLPEPVSGDLHFKIEKKDFDEKINSDKE